MENENFKIGDKVYYLNSRNEEKEGIIQRIMYNINYNVVNSNKVSKQKNTLKKKIINEQIKCTEEYLEQLQKERNELDVTENQNLDSK